MPKRERTGRLVWFSAALLIALALTASCATTEAPKKEADVCDDYRDLVCLTGKDCSYDAKRGCQVCRCSCLHGPCDNTMLTNPDLPRNVDPNIR
jgi:hypothetical protein